MYAIRSYYATPVAILELFPTKILPLFNAVPSLLLKVFQSVELKYPFVVEPAEAIEITGVVPPVEDRGELNVMLSIV